VSTVLTGEIAKRRDLPHGAWIDHYEAWLAPDEAGDALESLRNALAWETREIVLFGRRILQPRLVAWAGDVPYRYSGQTLEPRVAPEILQRLTERVVAATGTPFNHVLANRYRDGTDSMGLHADAEPELGPDPVVATLSLGFARRFVIVPRRGKDPRITYSLGAGSLLVMGGTCQTHYRHGIPKAEGFVGERISLTFRHIRQTPAPAR
jgi:alkylated DNA repair dioxygenase AlkB